MSATVDGDGVIDDTGPTAPSVVDSPEEPREAPIEFVPGTPIGDYDVERKLGAGGFSDVYAVRHRGDGHVAAVKVLSADGSHVVDIARRFRREVRALDRVRHPNVARIFHAGELPDGRLYYVMELVDGVTLSRLVRERGRLSLADAAAVIEAVGAALTAAHAERIVHRDVKPGNVLVAERGGARVVKLIDFGVAKLLDAGDEHGLTGVGQRIGTPVCMAPEQLRGLPIDHRVDVYALGVMLYYMLTGKYPFGRAARSDLERQILDAPAPRPSAKAPVPPAVDAVVLRCLEKLPARRYGSIDELVDAVRRAARTRPRAPSRPAPTRRALGLYVEAVYRGPDGTEPDDGTLDDMEELIAIAEEIACAEGFSLLLQTGSAMLCALVLPDALAAEHIERARALDVATEIYAELNAACAVCDSVSISIAVHIDRVTLDPDDLAIAGGALTSTAWVPRPPRWGVVPTASFRHAIVPHRLRRALGR